MPVRKILKNHRSLTGLVAATKRAGPGTSGGMAGFESSLERDLLILLDFDPDVLSYEEQPVRIDYLDAEGRLRHYTPDVLVRWRGDAVPSRDRAPLLVEVKYRTDLKANGAVLKPRLKAARGYAHERGWTFRILTEVEIRTPYLSNARFLDSYRRLNGHGAMTDLFLQTLHQLHESDPETLLAALRPDPQGRAELLPALWGLVAAGKVGVDLNLPLTMRSRLWWLDPDRPRTGDCLPAWQRRLAGRAREG
jgi:hypothetical protein